MRQQRGGTAAGGWLAGVLLTATLLGATPGWAQESYEPWVTDFGRTAPVPAYTPWVTDFGGGTEPEPAPVAAPQPEPTAGPAFDWSDAIVGAIGATLVWTIVATGALLLRGRRRAIA